MGKQVIRCNNKLLVRSRLFDDKIDKVVVNCGKVVKAFYSTPEKAFSDPDYLNSISLMGYRVSDLIIVAERLKAGGVDLMQLKDFTQGYKSGYAKAREDITEALMQSLQKYFGG